MSNIEFSSDDKNLLVQKLKRYFEQELNQELGQFDAEFLIDFISKEMGALYYNQGLLDARAVLQAKCDDIDAGIDELEKPTEFKR